MEKKNAPIVTEVPALTPEQMMAITKQIQNLPLMYFNHARIAVSNFDMRVFFGVGSITAQNEQSVQEQLCVVLTPEFAKNFAGALTTSLERYEKTFGQIRIPKLPPVALQSPTETKAHSKKSKKPN